MVRRIYFDMDGVLADFDRFVTENCGLTLTSDGWKPGGKEEMWRRASAFPHFYDLFEQMPGAGDLFRLVYSQYGDRCEILTGIPTPECGIINAAADKKEWMRRELSDTVKVNTVYKEEKPDYCEGADCILIDDSEENIEAWIAKGGTGILFTSAEQTLGELKKLGIIDQNDNTDDT